MRQNEVLSGFLWRFFERCGAQGVTLIVSIVLARLLDPEVYGTISLIVVFLTVLEVFVDSGLGNALIQKQNADNRDFSSVFYFNILFSVVLYVIMFCASPWIARFYNNDSLISYIRVLSLSLLISGVKNVQVAYVSRNMLFKLFFKATIIGTITSGIVGIGMAYLGFGVWSLIAQNLTNLFMDTAILWFTVKWRPQGKFSLTRFKGLFSFAWKLLVTNLIDTVYQKIRQLIIGKMYSPSDLAFYNQGQQLPYAIISNINASIDSVLLPTVSSVQDDKDRVKELTRKSISVSTYIITPLLLGMFAVSDTLVRVLLTEKWLPCVFYLRLACLSYVFMPINAANLNAIKSLGLSSVVLKLEIIKKITGGLILIATVFLGVKAIALGLLLASVLGQIINTWPNRKILSYGYFEQLKDILPGIVASTIMAILVMLLGTISLPSIVLLILQVICGGVVYIVLSAAFKLEAFIYIKNIAVSFIRKRGKQ
ncbi:lipopolysaccharide biosynthesis protein [Drancourtella sp. An177]|nr:lipopolysaccharide biosynthesis protein [Drancourtella sp. An177]